MCVCVCVGGGGVDGGEGTVYESVPNSCPPLRGTRSTTTNYLTVTANSFPSGPRTF